MKNDKMKKEKFPCGEKVSYLTCLSGGDLVLEYGFVLETDETTVRKLVVYADKNKYLFTKKK